MADTKRGQCLCGAVVIHVRDRSNDVGICHCGACRRWAGSMLAAVQCAEDAVTVEGRENVGTYTSSDWAERSWCKTCGSTLWYRVTAEGRYRGQHHIAFGVFDDPTGLSVTHEIFVDRNPGVIRIEGDHQKMTEAEVFAAFGMDGTET